MKKKISTLPFVDTPEQAKKLDEIIAKHKGEKGATLPVMQEAQEVYGYLPIEVQQKIATGLDLPISEIYGIATFYAQFSLAPKGKYNISVCLGTACYVKGAQALVDKITSILGIEPDECTEDGKFSLEACRCIGACGLAPVLTVNEDVYGRLTEKDIAGIIEKYQD